MSEFQMQQGATLFTKDTPLNSICLIEKGEVILQLAQDSLLLKENDVIGLLDLTSMTHSCNYIAKTDVVIDSIPIKRMEDVFALTADDPFFADCLASSTLNLIEMISRTYKQKCKKCDELFASMMEISTDYMRRCDNLNIMPTQLEGMNHMNPLKLTAEPPEYAENYYHDLKAAYTDKALHALFEKKGFLNGFLLEGCKAIEACNAAYQEAQAYAGETASLFINAKQQDFVSLYTKLLEKSIRPGVDLTGLLKTIERLFAIAGNSPSIDKSLIRTRLKEYEAKRKKLNDELLSSPEMKAQQNKGVLDALSGSIQEIFDFAGMDDDFCHETRILLEQYTAVKNKFEENDDLNRLRLKLTEQITQLYTKAFAASRRKVQLFSELSPTMKMFFLFGFISTELCGIDNSVSLYKYVTSDELYELTQHPNVFTFYEYLTLICEGEKEPHRNMMDQTFPAYVDSLIAEASIQACDKQAILSDPFVKVEFEIDNLLKSGQKMTYGRLTGFCPVLSEHDLVKSPDSCLATSELVMEALDEIRSVDFMAFCRETIFYNRETGIHNEMIQKEILPDIILLPNPGTRGILWQEIEGANRLSPACFVLPIMCLTELKQILLRLTGEFRWEMCKRMQGSRWNDVSNPSLTSEYFDYLQFFKKNSELSVDAKEKIKLQLQRTKNRFKENFLLDYMVWVMYESKGLPKLNPVARKILMRYCAPTDEYRKALIANPMFSQVATLYENKRVKELDRLTRLVYRFQKIGMAIPEELQFQLDLLKK